MNMTIDQQVALDEALVPHAKYFREMLHICPRLPGQTIDELPFKEEILAFLRFLGHSGEIRKLTDAQILWGMYHKKNVNFSYLLWEDFVYQVEHKDAKKSNKMYYPRFKKVIIHYFMSKDPSIPRRNKVKWHYVKDDQMFTTIKLVSRQQNTQQFGVMLPIELTNEDIRKSEAYKEYYVVALGATPPKTKASVKKMKSTSDTTITPPTAAGTRLSTSAKGKQLVKASKQTHISQASSSSADEGTSIILGVPDVPTEESDEEISWKSSDEDDDDDVDEGNDDQDEETKDEESFDHIVQTPENSDDKGNDDASHGLNVGSEEGHDAEYDEDELYRDVNISLEGRDVQMTDVHTTQEFKDTHVTLTPVNLDGQQQSSSVSSQFVTSMLNPSPDAGIDSFFETPPQMDVPTSTTVVSFTLTAPTLPPPTIPTNEAQAENEEFLKNLDENIQKIIKEKVKEQVKLKKILIEKIESNTSMHRSDEQRNIYKDLVEAYESDKIILDTYGDIVTLKRRHDDADKDEEPSVGSDRGPRDEEKEKSQSQQALQRIKQPRPLASLHKGPNLNKRLQASAADDQPIAEASHHPEWFQQQNKPPTPDHFSMNRLKVDTLTPELLAGLTYELMKGSCKSLIELKLFLEEVYKATTDQLDWNNPQGQQYPHNLLKPLLLIPNPQGCRVISFDHFINNDLKYLRGGASSRKYTTSVTKTKAGDYGHIKWIEDLVPCTMWSQEPVSYDKHALYGISYWGHKRQQFYGFAVNRESTRDVYSKHRIIAVTELQIFEWKADKSDGQRMLCFQRLSKNVHKKHRNPAACGRSSASDGTLNDVRTALDDRLKGIRMKYLPQAIWRISDKERATVMIQAIDKQLKTKRIMQSLEKFVGGRLYEGDFRILQRTI
nr:hypothetical protein [Tanacetum cinerariifolium]